MERSVLERAAWRMRRVLLARPLESCAFRPKTVAVAGLLSSSSGLGAGARYCIRALSASGSAPCSIDLSSEFGHLDFDSGYRRAGPAPLGEGLVVIHLNGPEFERACFLLGLWKGRRKKVIGYWAWELPLPPTGWEAALNYVHEVWTPSTFVADAIRPLTDKPVRVVPHYIPQAEDAGVPNAAEAREGARFLLIADGRSSFVRKNVAESIQTFLDASTHPSSRLIVKLRSARLFPRQFAEVTALAAKDDRIVLADRVFDEREYHALIDDADVLLSLHRAEGFGIAMAEFMAKGKPVIATGWSGNMEFMDEESAALVPYSLVPVDDPSGVYEAPDNAVWAAPDRQAAVSILSDLEADPDRRARIGAAAKARTAVLGDPTRWNDAVRGA